MPDLLIRHQFENPLPVTFKTKPSSTVKQLIKNYSWIKLRNSVFKSTVQCIDETKYKKSSQLNNFMWFNFVIDCNLLFGWHSKTVCIQFCKHWHSRKQTDVISYFILFSKSIIICVLHLISQKKQKRFTLRSTLIN